jgi:hypothetical protein
MYRQHCDAFKCWILTANQDGIGVLHVTIANSLLAGAETLLLSLPVQHAKRL